MKIILVRHGQTLFNMMNLTQGWCDSPLTKKGIEQAKETGLLLADYEIEAAYSSISERAYDTACYVMEGRNIPVKMDKRLKEMNFGVFEGQSNTLKDAIVEDARNFMTSYAPYGGESAEEMLEREMDFLKEVTADDHGQTILAAGHGLSLTCLVVTLAKESLEKKYPDFAFMGNAAAVILDYQNGKYEVAEIRGNYLKK